jgi:hypothetical protein
MSSYWPQEDRPASGRPKKALGGRGAKHPDWDTVFETTRDVDTTLTRECGCTIGWITDKTRVGFRYCSLHKSAEIAIDMMGEMYTIVVAEHFKRQYAHRSNDDLNKAINDMLEKCPIVHDDGARLTIEDIPQLRKNEPNWETLFLKMSAAIVAMISSRESAEDVINQMLSTLDKRSGPKQ